MTKRPRRGTEVPPDPMRVLREVQRIAFFDPRCLVDDEGRPRPLKDLDDDAAAAIESIEVRETRDGTVTRLRPADKLKALSMLAKYTGAEAGAPNGGGVVLLPEAGE